MRNYMQQIHKITQPFPEILQDLTKAFIDTYLHAKKIKV